MKVINIDDLLGIPHIKNGRDITSGLDCFGLAIEVEKRFGHKLIDLDEFKNTDKKIQDFEKDYLKLVKLKKTDTAETPGDLILFRDKSNIMSHIGVYLGEGIFIHSPNTFVKTDKLARYEHLIGRVYKWQ